MFGDGVFQGPDLPFPGFRGVDGGADLDQFLAAIGMAGEEIVNLKRKMGVLGEHLSARCV